MAAEDVPHGRRPALRRSAGCRPRRPHCRRRRCTRRCRPGAAVAQLPTPTAATATAAAGVGGCRVVPDRRRWLCCVPCLARHGGPNPSRRAASRAHLHGTSRPVSRLPPSSRLTAEASLSSRADSVWSRAFSQRMGLRCTGSTRGGCRRRRACGCRLPSSSGRSQPQAQQSRRRPMNRMDMPRTLRSVGLRPRCLWDGLWL